jgi:hypothetical protein
MSSPNSARAHHRILKLARTIADLAGCEEIGSVHLAAPLQYRPKLMMFDRMPAECFAIPMPSEHFSITMMALELEQHSDKNHFLDVFVRPAGL